MGVSCLHMACKDDFDMSLNSNPLHFSKDTLSFDTVFTTIGSATSKFMVYNTANKTVSIESVRLMGGSDSPFRINVDGLKHANHQFYDLHMRAKDSMFVFVEVHIDPNHSSLPVLVQDSVLFTVDGKTNKVLLQAHGQDIEILRAVSLLNDTALSPIKPYLIYDSLVVASHATLTLPAGTKFYFHKDADMYVYGNLVANGTLERPIEMRGDRLDKVDYVDPIPYHYVAGQWGGVYLLSPTGQHSLNYLDMRSGTVGIYFYNEDKNANPSLELHNSKIHNFLVYNLVAVNGDLTVSNSQITNSGSYTVYLNGGNHAFYHCTIANYFNYTAGRPTNRDEAPAVMLMDLNKQQPMESTFKNCIIAGTTQTELAIASKFIDKFKAEFSHSYIQKPKDTVLTIYKDIRWFAFSDTLFVSNRYDNEKNSYFDFIPDSVSPARGLADPIVAFQYPVDLHGKSRLADGQPDAGAYEWYPMQ